MIMQARSHNLGRIFLHFLLILQEVHAKCPFSCISCKKIVKILHAKLASISCKISCKITVILQEILQDIKISHLARSLYPAEYLAIQSCKMLLLEDMSSYTFLRHFFANPTRNLKILYNKLTASTMHLK